jgi:hypothetical protein
MGRTESRPFAKGPAAANRSTAELNARATYNRIADCVARTLREYPTRAPTARTVVWVTAVAPVGENHPPAPTWDSGAESLLRQVASVVSGAARRQAGEAGHSTGATSASALVIFLGAPIQVHCLGLKLVSVAKQPGFIVGSGERGRQPSGPFGEVPGSDSLIA